MRATVIVGMVLAVAGGCEKASHSPAAPVETAETPAPTPPVVEAPPAKSPAPAAPAAKATAADYKVDGFALGTRYSEIMARDPYRTPCDDDPIDRSKSERAMVYGGTPCRANAFPGGTSVIFFFPFEDPDVFDKPIDGFIWLGGDYFAKHSDVPVQPGMPAAKATELFGPPTATLDLPDRLHLRVQRHAGDRWVILDGDVIAGVGLGKLSDDPKSGYWQVASQMYRRYTARLVSKSRAAVPRADCEAAFDKIIALMSADPANKTDILELRSQRERKVAQCMTDATPAQVACVKTATDYAAAMKCVRN